MSSEVLSSDAKIKQEPSEAVTNSQQGTDFMSNSSTSPPSSPPVAKEEAAKEEMAVSRKRSHEQMNAELPDPHDSSATAIDEANVGGPFIKQSSSQMESSATIQPSTAAHSMLPPPAPVNSMLPPSQVPPRSGQGSKKTTQNSQTEPSTASKTTKVLPAEQSKAASSKSTEDDDDDSSDTLMLSDPQEKIEDFDWDDLQQGYHHKIKHLDEAEHGIMNEFNGLCDYFSIWAQAGATREVDRSFKRLKTQMTYVQHNEDQLEQKRQHYIKVVNAFKSALDLLIK